MAVETRSVRRFRRREIIYAIIFGILLAISLRPDSVELGMILSILGPLKEAR